jgi:hypothetical protein
LPTPPPTPNQPFSPSTSHSHNSSKADEEEEDDEKAQFFNPKYGIDVSEQFKTHQCVYVDSRGFRMEKQSRKHSKSLPTLCRLKKNSPQKNRHEAKRHVTVSNQKQDEPGKAQSHHHLMSSVFKKSHDLMSKLSHHHHNHASNASKSKSNKTENEFVLTSLMDNKSAESGTAPKSQAILNLKIFNRVFFRFQIQPEMRTNRART